MKEKEIVWLEPAQSKDLMGRFVKDPKDIAKMLGIDLTADEASAARKQVAELRRGVEADWNTSLFPLPRISGAPGGKRKPPGDKGKKKPGK